MALGIHAIIVPNCLNSTESYWLNFLAYSKPTSYPNIHRPSLGSNHIYSTILPYPPNLSLCLFLHLPLHLQTASRMTFLYQPIFCCYNKLYEIGYFIKKKILFWRYKSLMPTSAWLWWAFLLGDGGNLWKVLSMASIRWHRFGKVLWADMTPSACIIGW
jgi:hypothetical protein